MKRLLLLPIVLSLFGCATTDSASEQVDVFFDARDLTRAHKIMGTVKTQPTEYMSFELIEQQLVTDAMAKGADAIIIEGMDQHTIGSFNSTTGDNLKQPRYVVTEEGELKNVGGSGHYSSFSTTADITENVISARLVKYTD